MGLLSFGRLLRQLSPLERSHGQQGASTLGVCELGKPIALRGFAQAIFTGFHLPPIALPPRNAVMSITSACTVMSNLGPETRRIAGACGGADSAGWKRLQMGVEAVQAWG
jgi:hypothetical protein